MPIPRVSGIMLTLFLASAVCGQVSPPAVSAIQRADGKGYDVTITNTARSPITALFMQGTGPLPGEQRRVSLIEKDYAFTPREQPIASGEARTFRAADEAELKAVLFYDGTAAGDPEWVAAARKRRELALDAVKKVIQFVDEVRAQQRSRQEAIQELKGLEEAMIERARQQPLGPQGPALQGLDSFHARIFYGGAARDLAREEWPGRASVSFEDRLLSMKKSYLSTLQLVAGMVPELRDAARPMQ
jgi:hypothetical protein